MKTFMLLLGSLVLGSSVFAQEFEMRLRKRVLSEGESFSIVEETQRWNPKETAVIVCDMWDLHHCKNAVDRVGQMAPRMNAFIGQARRSGSLIIHAPSSCMQFYKDHPARKRALETPKAARFPEGINKWLNWIDEREEKAGYPIDHSDGGEDDDPAEHKAWEQKLKGMGKNPGAPWTRQVESLRIDPKRDAITDNGEENWSLLEAHGIRNVILVGVHTNMCVLGRPFGLRQMARNGKNVVLVRDLTDTMYNPKMPPQVSHFEGTDLIVEHIEKFVCPTVSSDQILGGAPYRFQTDPRKHVVFLVGEQEYQTKETLPEFAEKELRSEFRCTFVHADSKNQNSFPGIEAVRDADVLFVSVRRRTLPVGDLAYVRKHVEAGKAVVGIRTASHAFALRGKPAPPGHVSWERWDLEVIGGNYNGHLGNKLKTNAYTLKGSTHPILKGISTESIPTGGSLYRNSPLPNGSIEILRGSAKGAKQPEPVAWVTKRKDGGKTFYTSLGHVEDFKNASFRRILANGVRWAAGIPTK